MGNVIAKSLCILLALCTVFVSTSCSSTKKKKTPPPSATILTEKYSFGNYRAEFNTTLFFLDKAVRRACARAKLTKTEHVFRTTSCEYKFIDIDKIPVEIVISQLEETIEIKVRIGRFGDEESSRTLVVAVDEELRLLTQSAPAAN